MTITLDNISEAVASAEQHQDYAILMGLSGNQTEARRHAAHSKAIVAEVMRLTAPAGSGPSCTLSSVPTMLRTM